MSNLIVPDAYPCAFCDYLTGVRPFTILHRERMAAILVPREQRGISHLLVITTRHAPTLLDLHEAEAHAVMDLLQRASKAIDSTDRRPGISVWQNNGVDAHQAIPHFHFHVAGTVEGGSTNWNKVPELSISETDRIADRLRLNL
ncbi:HIT family protein [Streptomyces griseoaurantiacus]|uniref:HIT family protein n=1 Tax=Streptomyces griseoaurantiacus TaxID=68213 RepID=UPI00378F577B